MLKKVVSVMLCFGIFLWGLPQVTITGKCLGVSAQSAILMCMDNGKIIFEKNSESKLPMASTTKIMTAVLALEAAGANNKEVEFTKEMMAEGSSMYLKVGDKVDIKGLVKGLMSASGNDAANAIAYAVAGGKEEFAKLMNERAEQIGMMNTNFVTPSGLDDENHYSTARDMAVLMSYAMENEEFCNITSQKSVKVDFIKPENYSNTYNNHNRLLSLYEYCIGGKTGYTERAGRCLVSCAKKDGITLIAVTLNAPDDWNDHINMYNYGFDTMKSVEFDDTGVNYNIPVVGGLKSSVNITGRKPITCVIEKSQEENIKREVILPHFIYAPYRAGQGAGEIRYYIDGVLIGEVQLVATEEVRFYQEDKGFFAKLWDKFLEFILWK